MMWLLKSAKSSGYQNDMDYLFVRGHEQLRIQYWSSIGKMFYERPVGNMHTPQLIKATERMQDAVFAAEACKAIRGSYDGFTIEKLKETD